MYDARMDHVAGLVMITSRRAQPGEFTLPDSMNMVKRGFARFDQDRSFMGHGERFVWDDQWVPRAEDHPGTNRNDWQHYWITPNRNNHHKLSQAPEFRKMLALKGKTIVVDDPGASVYAIRLPR